MGLMGFQIRKISNHGTSNPIVARLAPQSHELMDFSTLSKEKKEELLLLLHEQIMPRLLTCDTISRRVVQAIEDAVSNVKKHGLPTQAQGRVVDVPHIANLEQDVEQFLYSAKSVLRDAAKMFKIFFDKEFPGARYDRVLAWAIENFGEQNELVRVLREDQELWIRRIVDMRNAVEHPGGHAGRLHVNNFVFSQNRLIRPTWRLDDEPIAGIAHDMPIYVDNMMTLCEDLLIFCIRTSGTIAGVDFAEIPESDRIPDCPKRFRAILVAKPSKK